jgi:hypothetical protein
MTHDSYFILYFRTSTFNADEFNKLLAEWVASDDQPFLAVESPFFRKLVTYLNSSATVPCAGTIRNCITTNHNNNRGKFISLLNVSDFIFYFLLFACFCR